MATPLLEDEKKKASEREAIEACDTSDYLFEIERYEHLIEIFVTLLISEPEKHNRHRYSDGNVERDRNSFQTHTKVHDEQLAERNVHREHEYLHDHWNVRSTQCREENGVNLKQTVEKHAWQRVSQQSLAVKSGNLLLVKKVDQEEL